MITPKILWKFSRPLPAKATVVQVVAAYALAMHHAGVLRFDAVAFVLALVCASGLHVYVNGVNQLSDIEIDRINKSSLPLASGVMSEREGLVVTIGAAILSLVIGATQSMSLLVTAVLYLVNGSLYSLPPVRLKSTAFGAGGIIAITRGVILPLGMFSYFNTVLSGAPGLSFEAVILAVFSFGIVFSVALVKDIPDIEGDSRNGLKTAAIVFGPSLTFRLAVGLVSLSYALLVIAGLVRLSPLVGLLLLVTHLGLLAFFLMRSRAVRLDDKMSVGRFYQLFWKLMYAEYIVFPAICFFI